MSTSVRYYLSRLKSNLIAYLLLHFLIVYKNAMVSSMKKENT